MSHINEDICRAVRHRINNHTMNIEHDDGPYRHLYFHNPTSEHRTENSFHITTWPNYALIHGDLCNAHLITSTPDTLLDLCNVDSINHHYWAQRMRAANPTQLITRPTKTAATAWIQHQIDTLIRHHNYTLTSHDLHTIQTTYEDLLHEDGTLDWQDLDDLPTYHADNGDTIQLLEHDPIDYAPKLESYTFSFLAACEALRHAGQAWAHHTTPTTPPNRIPGAIAKTNRTPIIHGTHNGYHYAVTPSPGDWYCGYIQLPDTHPWLTDTSFYAAPDQAHQHVHGGITYRDDTILGFDTGHTGDTPTHWTPHRVEQECIAFINAAHKAHH